MNSLGGGELCHVIYIHISAGVEAPIPPKLGWWQRRKFFLVCVCRGGTLSLGAILHV